MARMLLFLFLCLHGNEKENVQMVENFITYYYRKPDPTRVPAILDNVMKGPFVDDQAKRMLSAHAFGHIARSNQKLIRLYESQFTQASPSARSFLIDALALCGDDVTQRQLEVWARDPRYADQKRELEAAASSLANPKRLLPRNRPARIPIDLDLLWADFMITGEFTPIARILDTLDQTSSLRQQITDCLKKNRQERDELLDFLKKLKLIQPGSKDKLVDGHLELILLHDPKGRLRYNAIEDAGYLGKQILNLSDEELNRGLLLMGAASWSLQDNLKQHPVLAELMKKHYRERRSPSQDLIKKWLRIDQPKIVLDNESERLQGTWQATAWEEDGDADDRKLKAETLRHVRWIFEDNELTTTKAFTVTSEDTNGIKSTEVTGEGTPWISSYRTNGSTNPKEITLTSTSPEEGNITRYIYALEGDILRVCISKKDQVPKDFSGKKGSDCIFITLKKVPEGQNPSAQREEKRK